MIGTFAVMFAVAGTPTLKLVVTNERNATTSVVVSQGRTTLASFLLSPRQGSEAIIVVPEINGLVVALDPPVGEGALLAIKNAFYRRDCGRLHVDIGDRDVVWHAALADRARDDDDDCRPTTYLAAVAFELLRAPTLSQLESRCVTSLRASVRPPLRMELRDEVDVTASSPGHTAWRLEGDAHEHISSWALDDGALRIGKQDGWFEPAGRYELRGRALISLVWRGLWMMPSSCDATSTHVDVGDLLD